MQAAYYTAQGPASQVLTVGEQPKPVPGPGEVRVRIRASGINPSDVKSRGVGFRPMQYPLVVPHSDGAGCIDAVGENVSRERIGERVWIWNGQWQRAHGTAAQYIALPSEQAVHLPDSVGYNEGACLGIPALTAYRAVKLTGADTGQTVLIIGGAGAVGHYAIQMAKARGIRVLTTVSSADKAAHARAAGADATINYRTENVAERIQAETLGRGVDAIVELDLSANASLIPRVLAAHGTVVVYGLSGNEVSLDARWLLRSSVTLRFFLIYDLSASERQDALAAIGRLLSAGSLRHAIDCSLPLERIVAAHELVESGRALGNVVLEVPE